MCFKKKDLFTPNLLAHYAVIHKTLAKHNAEQQHQNSPISWSHRSTSMPCESNLKFIRPSSLKVIDEIESLNTSIIDNDECETGQVSLFSSHTAPFFVVEVLMGENWPILDYFHSCRFRPNRAQHGLLSMLHLFLFFILAVVLTLFAHQVANQRNDQKIPFTHFLKNNCAFFLLSSYLQMTSRIVS